MNKVWNILAWTFFTIVLSFSVYTWIRYNCWFGVLACLSGFAGGTVYGRFKGV